jgi:hypothetical protein
MKRKIKNDSRQTTRKDSEPISEAEIDESLEESFGNYAQDKPRIFNG